MMPHTFAEWAVLAAPYLTIAGVLRWHFHQNRKEHQS